MLLAVDVKPGSKTPGLSIDGKNLTIRVRERAVDGAANEACIRALSEALGIPRSNIELVSGPRSRTKRYEISLETAIVWERLHRS